MKKIELRNWLAKDCETDEEMLDTLLDILTDAVNNPSELDWVRDSVELHAS